MPSKLQSVSLRFVMLLTIIILLTAFFIVFLLVDYRVTIDMSNSH